MILAVDTETTGTDFFHGCKPFMVTACDGQTNFLYTGQVNPLSREVFWSDEDLDLIQELINSYDQVVFHNANFDIRALASIGINVKNVEVEDTLLMAHALHSGKSDGANKNCGRTLGLKDLAVEYLDYWDDDEDSLAEAVKLERVAAKARGWDIARHGHEHFPGARKETTWYKMDYWLCVEECTLYGEKDAERTYLLYHAFRRGLLEEGLYDIYQLRKKLLPICYRMQSNGIPLYEDKAKEYIEELDERMLEIVQAIRFEAEIPYKFTPSKPKHLIDLLHNRLAIPIMFKTETGQPSTNKAAIKYYEKEYKDFRSIKLLSKHRKIATVRRYLSSYLKWAKDGKIHSSINITGTRETRQSATDPNIQNFIPELKRRFIGPQQGYVHVSIDLTNIELVIWAYMVKSKELIEAFEKKISVHLLIFEVVYKDVYDSFNTLYPELYTNHGLLNGIQLLHTVGSDLYKRCKGGTFSIIYGAQEEKTDDTYGRKGSRAKVEARFPEVKAFTESCHREVFDNAEILHQPCIHTLGGYRLDVPITEPHASCNYKVQGSAGLLMSFIMIALYNYIEQNKLPWEIISQVHDEITISIPPDNRLEQNVNLLVDITESAGGLIFPPYSCKAEIKYHPHDKPKKGTANNG